MGYDLHKYERFHTFSKVPAGATSELAVAVNKAGHIVQASEVRAEAIPYCGIQGSLADIQTAYATYPVGTLALVRGTDNLYQKTGDSTWTQIAIPAAGSYTAITANGAAASDDNKPVLRWHYKVPLTYLNPANNGQDSNRFSARYLGVDGVSDAIAQFVTPTDNILNNAVSSGYDIQIFKNGSAMNKGESEANDQWMDSPYAGMILFMAQQATSDKHTMTCFEYCGKTVSEAIADITVEASGGIKSITPGAGIEVDSTTAEGLRPTVSVKTSDFSTATIATSADTATDGKLPTAAAVRNYVTDNAKVTVISGTVEDAVTKLTVSGTDSTSTDDIKVVVTPTNTTDGEIELKLTATVDKAEIGASGEIATAEEARLVTAKGAEYIANKVVPITSIKVADKESITSDLTITDKSVTIPYASSAKNTLDGETAGIVILSNKVDSTVQNVAATPKAVAAALTTAKTAIGSSVTGGSSNGLTVTGTSYNTETGEITAASFTMTKATTAGQTGTVQIASDADIANGTTGVVPTAAQVKAYVASDAKVSVSADNSATVPAEAVTSLNVAGAGDDSDDIVITTAKDAAAATADGKATITVSATLNKAEVTTDADGKVTISDTTKVVTAGGAQAIADKAASDAVSALSEDGGALKALTGRVETAEGAIEDLEALVGTTPVATQITNAINELDVAESNTNGIKWSQTDGEISISVEPGSIASGNTSVVTGGTVYDAIKIDSIKVGSSALTIAADKSVTIPTASAGGTGVGLVTLGSTDELDGDLGATSTAAATEAAVAKAIASLESTIETIKGTGVNYAVAATLPTAGADYLGWIYLIKDTTSADGDYIEHICVNSGTADAPVYTWEQIGSTKADHTVYASTITLGTNNSVTVADNIANLAGKVVTGVATDNGISGTVDQSTGIVTLTVQDATSEQKGIVTLSTQNAIAAATGSTDTKVATVGAVAATIAALDAESSINSAGLVVNQTDGKVSASLTTASVADDGNITNGDNLVTANVAKTIATNIVNGLDATIYDNETTPAITITETDGKLSGVTLAIGSGTQQGGNGVTLTQATNGTVTLGVSADTEVKESSTNVVTSGAVHTAIATAQAAATTTVQKAATTATADVTAETTENGSTTYTIDTLSDVTITAADVAGATSVEGNKVLGANKYVDWTRVTNAEGAFVGSTLTAFHADLDRLTTGTNMFSGTGLTSFCGNLSSLAATGAAGMFQGCTLDEESVIYIIDSLPTVTGGVITIGVNSTVDTSTYDDEADAKGWDVTWLAKVTPDIQA